VFPALHTFRSELERRGRTVLIREEGSEVKKEIAMLVTHQGEKEFDLQLRLEVHRFRTLYPYYSSSYPRVLSTDTEREVFFTTEEGQKRTIEEVSAEELLQHIYRHYREKLCIMLNVTKSLISDEPLNEDELVW
jgi:hypothetical protein